MQSGFWQGVTNAAAVAGIGSLLFAAMAYGREWSASFRRFTGWLAVVAGLAAVVLAGTPVLRMVRGVDRPAWLPVCWLAAGLFAAGFGAVRVRRSPLEPVDAATRSLAAASRQALDRQAAQRAEPAVRHVELTGEVVNDLSRRPVTLTDEVAGAAVQLLVLAGPSGSGKSSTLVECTRRVTDRALGQRRPRRMMVYVDLALAGVTGGQFTADTIRDLVLRTVAADNSTIEQRLAQHLREPRSAPQWTFVFDAFDDLGLDRGSAARFVRALHAFVNTGPGFRAVLAVRDHRSIDLATTRAVVVDALTDRQCRDLVMAAGLPAARQRQLLTAVRHDPALRAVAASPHLLAMLCSYVLETDSDVLPGSVPDLVEASLSDRLRQSSDTVPAVSPDVADAAPRTASTVADAALRTAERLASDPAHRPVVPPDPAARPDLDLLIRAGILMAGRDGAVTFRHRWMLDQLAALWLVRTADTVDPHELVDTPRWQEALLAALPRMAPATRERIAAAAAARLAAGVAHMPGISTDVASCLATPPTDDLPAPREHFSWPTELDRFRRIVEAAAALPGEVEPGARDATDRLVVSAFAAGQTRYEPKLALAALPAASAEVAAWAVERAAYSGSAWLQETAADQLIARPDLFARLRTAARLRMLPVGAVRFCVPSPAWVLAAGTGRATATFRGTLAGLLRVMRVLCVLTAVLVGFQLLNGPAPFDAGVWTATLALVLTALYWLTVPSQRLREGAVVMVAPLASIIGLVSLTVFGLGRFGEILVHPDDTTIVLNAVVGLACTWPLAMAAALCLGAQPANRRDWLLPQWTVVLLGVEEVRTQVNASVLATAARRVSPVAWYLTATATVVLGVVFAPDDVEGYTAIVLISLFVAARLLWQAVRRRSERRQVRRNLADGDASAGAVLLLLSQTRTQEATGNLLSMLPNAAPELLQRNRPAIEDLARALEHVRRVVPAGTTGVIPRGVWDLGPAYHGPGFVEWLSGYDRRFPGRLPWLAATHRDELAKALDRAPQTPVVPPQRGEALAVGEQVAQLRGEHH